MKHAVQALVWEQVWKNRVVFPVLALLLLSGSGLAHLLIGVDPEVWWYRLAMRSMLTLFCASVLLCFAPFTLMENHPGWRMNSMVTRWFVLPVSTGVLVLVPFLSACLVTVAFMGTWMLLFQRVIPGLDFLHVLLVLVLGIAAIQTLAWVLPRNPGQFWPVVALGFPFLMMLAVLPLDGPSWEPQRRYLRLAVPVALPLLGLLAYAAARFHRCGSWSGELVFPRLPGGTSRGRSYSSDSRSPHAALFWSDVFPNVRLFTITWICFYVMIMGLQLWVFGRRQSQFPMSLGLVMQVGVVLLPPLALFWLAVSGLLLGNEPGMGFRTALSSFRAVRPVSAGQLAAQRVSAAVWIWLLVWVPWLVMVSVHRQLYPQWAEVDVPELTSATGRWIAVSANVLIGALPVFLWGRLQGFPNQLLAAMTAWLAAFGLASLVPFRLGETSSWMVLGGLLGLKWLIAVVALAWAWRRGHITWVYASGLLAGWVAVMGVLAGPLSTWSHHGWWGVASCGLFLPLARLAAAPLAVAANRHR